MANLSYKRWIEIQKLIDAYCLYHNIEHTITVHSGTVEFISVQLKAKGVAMSLQRFLRRRVNLKPVQDGRVFDEIYMDSRDKARLNIFRQYN